MEIGPTDGSSIQCLFFVSGRYYNCDAVNPETFNGFLANESKNSFCFQFCHEFYLIAVLCYFSKSEVVSIKQHTSTVQFSWYNYISALLVDLFYGSFTLLWSLWQIYSNFSKSSVNYIIIYFLYQFD